MRDSATRVFKSGDLVVYRKQKQSAHPGPRAVEVHASRFGDDYRYLVDKFYIVDRVESDGSVVVRTRKGRRHTLNPTDPCLRHASWWSRLLHRRRFAALTDTDETQPA